MLAGIDIGGTKCALIWGSVYNGEMRIQGRHCIPTEKGEEPLKFIRRLIESAGIPDQEITAAGVSCGGPLDSAGGIILSPPNLPGWDEIPVVEFLKARWRVPVFLENDANACALAEWKYGNGRGCRNMVFLTFGTGMGAGLILNGRLYRGSSDSAGEIGHIRMAEHGPAGYGKQGSFEGFCSGGGIARMALEKMEEYRQRGEKSRLEDVWKMSGKITAKDVAQLAVSGDRAAGEVMKTSAEMLGRGVAVLADLLNPEKIIIGSVYSRCEELMRDVAARTAERECLSQTWERCRICGSYLGDEIGDYAALAVAAGGTDG